MFINALFMCAFDTPRKELGTQAPRSCLVAECSDRREECTCAEFTEASKQQETEKKSNRMCAFDMPRQTSEISSGATQAPRCFSHRDVSGLLSAGAKVYRSNRMLMETLATIYEWIITNKFHIIILREIG